ncbi:hypothetical protein BofuT4_uP155970.1 [Botrytis cinerea T4]|uniref:Uncharacterized protein n=1 Tax=Botryotinia fuckeliana (strain T4) TaxID=999810 RepID=G2YUA3_BOTF4|nr:hypothetical protein BofuT4_uP155970.1 [Botrytis cinerea T4]
MKTWTFFVVAITSLMHLYYIENKHTIIPGSLRQISIGIEIEITTDRGKEAGGLKTNAVPPLGSLQADPKKHRFIADRRE